MEDQINLTEPELQVMQAVWAQEGIPAKDVTVALAQSCDYSPSTAYTLIYRCIKKGALSREDPGFLLNALVSREQAQRAETKKLVDRLYEGSIDNLFAALIDRWEVSPGLIERLRADIDDYEKGID